MNILPTLQCSPMPQSASLQPSCSTRKDMVIVPLLSALFYEDLNY